MRYLTLVATLWLGCSAALAQAPAPASAAPGPAEVVQAAAQGMLGELDKDREGYRKDPTKVEGLVDAFYHSLLKNYGSALAEFTADRLKIFPTKVDGDATRATVRTEVKRDNGDRVSVNYYMRKTAEGWKAWDVVIDGISYVNSYREDFGPQIESQGIDAVIKRLDSGEKPEAIGKQTK
jgi:ABC-type transporter MlaC component